MAGPLRLLRGRACMRASPIRPRAAEAAPHRRRGRPLRVLGLVLGGWVALRLALAGLAMTGVAGSAFHEAQRRESMLAARPGSDSQEDDSALRPPPRKAGARPSAIATRQDVIAVSAMAADRDGFAVRPAVRQPAALLATLDGSRIPFARE